MAQFAEHDRTGGQLGYINLDQIVVADYYTIGAESPFLILHMSNGTDLELQGKTAEQCASILSTNTVTRINSRM
jgi:hypothetical protein